MPSISLGLDGLPRESLILIEEELGDAKRIFIQMLGAEGIRQNKKIVYITDRSREEVYRQAAPYGLKEVGQFEIVEKYNDGSRLYEVCTGDLCLIDGFSHMNLDANGKHMVTRLHNLRNMCNQGRIIVITSDMGVLPKREESTTRALVDGIIQFTTQKGEDHITYCVYIPKMRGLSPSEKFTPFKIAETGISIDTRERFT